MAMNEMIPRRGPSWLAYEFESSLELAAGVAKQFLSLVENDDQLRSVALSGGRITEALFREIVANASSLEKGFHQLNFFWADERCVPLDDPASNYRLARELLFDPLSIDPSQTFPFAGGETPLRMAELGRSMLERYLSSANTSARGDTLDLVFLGMGEDGHIASLFPENQSSDLSRDELCYDVVASKPPPNRITLSYPVLTAAKEVWLVISGEGKAEVLCQALRSEGATPLKELFARRGLTKVFTDISLDEFGRSDSV